jgi:hypothetical protein
MKKLKHLVLACLLGAGLAKAQNNTRINCYYDQNDKKSYYIAWDIKTGTSIQYYWDGTQHKYLPFEINLPAQPVPGATGNVLYDVYYDYNDQKAYYIAWDTKSGKSVQYYWDGSQHKYAAFEINLPENSLPGHTGEVMIKVYYSSEDGKAYYVVYDTNGGKSIQYYWDGSQHKYLPFEINLPEKPLVK